ncbi:4-(cytidine 5'-diphospho)-2-C-methyl-D-erythritol kinase [Oceanidesulfovibrio marinus]|uniref:4-diphosphocytidyl-2-C-methyl-D-erythritol kinase n=1 Tax=Oceanidesulfovibrio marinus TaxID=370038 RepID=A0A6P1ZIU2_9BACT|nr:4-(cytidine 5'-diphospho)-2-C-methyl-D-erythritol kinase [Oceanidesulfovibrio marinus]TVM35137.1 4-(cytidine 5'-diphospho)-2-C-methyl-D-erythritol kinase [Oceanidesulfovibrio marinus]
MDTASDQPLAVLTPGCKVNLHLRIGPKREDGYHELETFFYPLPEPHDVLTIRTGTAGGGCVFSCDPPLPGDGPNLVERAYAEYAKASGFAPDIAVHLEKRIPAGAGLGGGSSDAAAMLRWLEDAAGDKALGETHLARIAVGLGADVPFFLLGEPAWAGGVGDELTPAQMDWGSMTLLLLDPHVHVSTGWAYGAWDGYVMENPAQRIPLTSKAAEHKKTLFPAGTVLGNDFERVVFSGFPALRRLKESLLAEGASVALLSGSGACLFGLFRSPEQAKKAGQRISATPPPGIERLDILCMLEA